MPALLSHQEQDQILKNDARVNTVHGEQFIENGVSEHLNSSNFLRFTAINNDRNQANIITLQTGQEPELNLQL